MNKVLKILLSAIAIIISIAIIWRLPVNGWGSFLWLLGMIIMSVVRRPHEKLNAKNVIEQSRRSKVEIALLLAVILGSALIPIFHLIFGIFNFVNYTAPYWLSIIGAIILGIGLWLFWRSHTDLGRNWSVTLEIREGHTLISSGVYNRIRHPMYTSIFLIFAAQVFLINNWIAGFAGLVSFTIMYVIRVPMEEIMMQERFGDDYNAYCEKTGRLLPKLFAS